MNELKLISTIGIVLLASILGVIIYYEVLEQSYVSYAESCLKIDPSEYGYYQSGKTTQNTTSGEVKIQIRNDLPTEERIKVMKHEIIHRNQLVVREIDAKCYNLYFMEMEAYTFQNLPIKLFKFFYM